MKYTFIILAILVILASAIYPLYKYDNKYFIDKEFDEQSYLCDRLNSVDKEGFTYGLRTKDGHVKCELVGIEAP